MSDTSNGTTDDAYWAAYADALKAGKSASIAMQEAETAGRNVNAAPLIEPKTTAPQKPTSTYLHGWRQLAAQVRIVIERASSQIK